MDVTARFRADVSDMKAKMSEVQGSLKKTAEETAMLQNKMLATGQTMTQVGKKMSLAVTLPLVGLGVAATKMSMDFDASMVKITSLVGIASEEVDGMKKSVLALSGETAKSPKELADALFVVTSAGLRGQEALDALEASAKAGAAGLGETGDIARAVAGSMNAYGAETLSAARATDIIVATARAGNFETSQFAGALGRVLPFAKQAGASLEEVGGSVALLTRTNGDAAQSITQVSALMRAFVVPTEEAKKALGDAGLSASDMRDRISKDGLASALQFLDKSLGGNREQLGKLLGSSEAAGAAFQILDADAQTLKDTFGVVTDSVGMTDDAFKITSESSAFKMQQAITQIKNSLIEFGAIISPFVVAFAGGFATVANAVNSLPGPIKMVAVGFGLLLAAVGPVLTIFGKAITIFVGMNASLLSLQARFVSAFTTMRAAVTVWSIQIKTAMIAAKTQIGALGLGARAAGSIFVTSFRAMGTAAKGLLVSLGPVGLGLIGITIAYEAFSGSQQEAKQKVENLTEAMKEQNGVIGESTALILAENFQALSYGFAEATGFTSDLESLGFTLDEVVTAVLKGDSAINELSASMITSANGNKNLEYAALNVAAAMLEQSDDVKTAKAEYDSYQASVTVAQNVTKSMGGSAEGASESVDGLTTELLNSSDGAAALQTEVQKLSDMFTTMDANIAAVRAKDELRTLLRGMDEAIAENNRSLSGNGAAATKNRDAVLTALQAGAKDVQAWATANDASTDQVEARFKENTIALKAELVKQGFDEDEIEAFLGADSIDTASVNVRDQMTTAIGVLADRVGPAAFAEFKGVGRDVMSGLVLGIDIGIPPMERKMSTAILAAKAAAQATGEIKSPSKVFERIGKQLMAGLEKGIDEKSEAVAEKARAAIQKIIDKVQEQMDVVDQEIDGFKSYREGVAGQITSLLDLGAAYDSYTDRQQAVTTTLAELMKYQATIQGESTDDQKTKLAELQTAYRDAQADAASGAQSIVDEFIQQGEKLSEFNSNMQTLLKAGLSKNAFDAIMAESGGRGADIAAALAQGNIAENARRVSDVYRSVQAMGDQTGQMAAETFLGNGVKLALQMLAGMIKEFAPSGKLRKTLLAAVKSLNDSIKFEPKYIDIITRRFDQGSAPAAVVAGGGVNAAGGGAGNFTNDELTEAMLSYTGPIFPPGFEFDFSGIGGISSIGQFADGGVATKPTLGIFGEAGPEALVPLSRGGNSGLGGNTYSITINTGIGDPRVIGEEVVNVISKFEKANGAVFARA
jgi:TP901 family phage tail tape measure protein